MSSIALSLLVIFISLNIGKNNDRCEIDNSSFVDGEVLVYKIYYNWKFVWIPAGEVKFNVVEGEQHYEFIAEGKTYSSYDNFFKVRDYYYSRVNKETLFPESFVRRVEEGKYLRYDSIMFDQKKNIAISYWGNTSTSTSKYNFNLDGCMQDMLSILYYVRNHDYSLYQTGDSIPVKIFFDKETYPLKVMFYGKEKSKDIKDQGKFNTLKFIPEVVAGYVFSNDTKMNLWVSDDKNKIPLMVESPISIGSIKAVLKRYKNLRHPLTSKIYE